MSQPISTIAVGKLPTPDELYDMATFIEDAAAVADVLVDARMTEGYRYKVFKFLSTSLAVAGEVLALGLDHDSGTFSKLKEVQKAS